MVYGAGDEKVGITQKREGDTVHEATDEGKHAKKHFPKKM